MKNQLLFGPSKEPVSVVMTKSGCDAYLTRYPDPGGDEVAEPANVARCTAQQMADFLDHEAENANRHDFVGVHSYLVGLLRECADESPEVLAHRVMHKLVQRGGLAE